ncbi:hypothetical protein B0J15DRAFT_398298 [Fusarium solani]|uniref:YCII-related domain-containing protein n=1 Tax=Fusarium solani TaxID=169388 RepID=A0A9P9HAD9_FUSSL|nr:uncharacterized protein B0J15DRAFT_398298 [Fusarium solani]KAH7253253.1 hypothetical protein B0J15DRAFT_398298 [Fusarium solani]
MATSVVVSVGNYEFLVVLPDKPGVREEQHALNLIHFRDAAAFRDKGTWKTGGALLNDVPKDDKAESLDFFGSAFVVVAESVDKVREQFSQDVYATAGVWDMEKIQIYPFRAVFRDP